MKAFFTPFKKADEFLKEFNIIKPPISNNSLNEIMNKLEIQFYEIEMKDEISGILEVKENIKRIIVNKKHHSNRKRFTIAHEIGHYVLHHKQGIHVDTIKFRRSDLENDLENDLTEVEANRFAGALLMPKKFIEDTLKNNGETPEEELITNLANNFCVSKIAMTIRLESLGYFFF